MFCADQSRARERTKASGAGPKITLGLAVWRGVSEAALRLMPIRGCLERWGRRYRWVGHLMW